MNIDMNELSDNALRDRYRYYCGLLCGLLIRMKDSVDDDKINKKIERLAFNDVKKFLPVLEEIRTEVLRRSENATF